MARPVHPAHEAEIPAPSSGLASGAVINDTVLGACTVQGLRPGQASGDKITVAHSKGPTIAVPAASATTFSKGDTIEYKNSTGLAVADTAGDFDIGKALKAKVAGELEVFVVVGA